MKHYIKIAINRLISVRKDLLILLSISLLTILIIEFWLIRIPAPFDFFFPLGQISLKISYSYFSAFIFYFLVVHYPRERRRAKSYRQLNNKISYIGDELKDVIVTIFRTAGHDYKGADGSFNINNITEEEFKEACKNVNPNGNVNSAIHFPPFSNWYEFLTFKGNRIKTLIGEILILGDIVESEILELTTFVDDETYKFIYERKRFNNKDLEHLARTVYIASKETDRLYSALRKEYQRYNYEYHYNYRQKNKG